MQVCHSQSAPIRDSPEPLFDDTLQHDINLLPDCTSYDVTMSPVKTSQLQPPTKIAGVPRLASDSEAPSCRQTLVLNPEP